jgi:hypothetical protein
VLHHLQKHKQAEDEDIKVQEKEAEDVPPLDVPLLLLAGI